MARAIFAILLVGGLVTLGFMLDAGEPDKLWWWAGFLPFAGWALVPYAALALVAHRLRSSRRSLWVLLVAAAVLSGSAAALLYQAFVTNIDAQSGIVFVILPLWQLIGCVPFLLLSLSLRPQPNSEFYELDWPEDPPSEA